LCLPLQAQPVSQPTNKPTEHIPRETNGRSSSQEIYRPVWHLKIPYHVDSSLPLDPVLSQMNPVDILRPCQISELNGSNHPQNLIYS